MESGRLRLAGLALGGGLLLWGARALCRAPTRAAVRVHVLLFTLLLFAPLCIEIGLRVALSSPHSALRNPGLFADPYSEDDYWKLQRLWFPERLPHNEAGLDPLLGWTRPKQPADPFGVHRPLGYEPRTAGAILCFGDSFMSSKPDVALKIPVVVEQQIPERVSYNFGGGGYGLGQIYLRFRENHLAFDDPIVVVGIMEFDLDRTVLSVRSAPKPRFRVEGGELTLQEPGVVESLEQWYAEHPVELRSFALAWAANVPRRRQGHSWLPYRRTEKERVNRALLEQLIADAREHERRLLFITFPMPRRDPGWRRQLMAEVFDARGIPWVDGAAALEQRAREERVSFESYFRPDNHPTAHGNQILGEALAARVVQLWGDTD